MFEPQDHPNDFAYPGGPPIPPYDSAGWTLAYQMGVEFDRILDAFDGPFERLTAFIEPKATVPPLDAARRLSPVRGRERRGAGREPPARRRRARVAAIRSTRPAPAPGSSRDRRPRAVLTRAAAELGVTVTPVAARPAGDSVPVARRASASWTSTAARCRPGGSAGCSSSTSSRSRSCSRRCSTPASLNARYDVLIVADDLIPAPGRRSRASAVDPATVPEPYRSQIGPHHAGADGPGAEGVPRRRRHDRHHRQRRRRWPRTCACRSRARW